MHSKTEIQHFLEFSMRFSAFSKYHFHRDQELQADSLAFQALVSLSALSRQELTMSELAKEMIDYQTAAYQINQQSGTQGTGRANPQSNQPAPGLYTDFSGWNLCPQNSTGSFRSTLLPCWTVLLPRNKERSICAWSI